MKIKNIEISGIRGIKESINISLDNSKSLLLYGDNGSGKSSITDGLEWFYYDRPEHLKGDEIGKGKDWVEAFRNIFLNSTDEIYIDLKYSDAKKDSKRILGYKGKKVIDDYSNPSEEFKNYRFVSQQERLILTYKDILKFIVFSKTEKLQEISNIIGYSEVTKLKATLKKVVGEIRREIKNSNFEQQKSAKLALFMAEARQPINTDQQYYDAIKILIEPLNLSTEISSHENINEVLKLIKTSDTKEAVAVSLSYINLVNGMKMHASSIETLQEAYKSYYAHYKKISGDAEKMSKMHLRKLLDEGLSLLESGNYKEDICPLCLQDKNRDELIEELKKKIEELSVYEKQITTYNEEKNNIQEQIQGILTSIEGLNKEKCLNIETDIKNELIKTKNAIQGYIENIKRVSLFEKIEPLQPEEFKPINKEKTESMISVLSSKITKIDEENKENPLIKISVKIELIRQAYSELQALKKKEEIFNIQLKSMDVICEHFIKKQKEALNTFLTSISKDMNEYYLYMNQDEKVDGIELISMGEGDELDGITIQYKFHGNVVSPPEKYLSESHLNCLGIALFLSSVKTFNKNNKFFVLDDVISSFDRPHRIRFARLLLEKFNDYQIFLFTHEYDWFQILTGMVRSRNWIIKKVIWTDEKGSEVDMIMPELKDRIEAKFKKSDTNDLGNMIRRYLERLLKDICYNLEVKLKFLFNENNEKRMPGEMLSEIRSKLNSRKCEIKDCSIIDNISKSAVLCNWTSHDSSYTESIDDLKILYDDILQLENIFKCGKVECKKIL